MSQYLSEIALRRADTTRLALRARRLYDWSAEAADRGNLRRSAMLATMSHAYAAAGLGWTHSRFGSLTAWDLFRDSQERISFARYLTEAWDAPTVRVTPGATQ